MHIPKNQIQYHLIMKISSKKKALINLKEKKNSQIQWTEKTKLLNPGEEQTLEMEISYKEMASFDSETSSWKMEKGEYQFKAGNSSENFAQVKTVAINNTFTEKCSDVLRPKQNFEVIKK